MLSGLANDKKRMTPGSNKTSLNFLVAQNVGQRVRVSEIKVELACLYFACHHIWDAKSGNEKSRHLNFPGNEGDGRI